MSRLRHRVKPSARLPRRPVSPKARLFVRALEDRIVPATFTVTNTGDTGTGTGMTGDLRYCITQANVTTGPNTIDATGVAGTITLTSALPTVVTGHDLTIAGPGPGVLTVSGANSFHILVDNTSNFAVEGMTLSNGLSSDSGGGIQMSAANEVLTVTNCDISGCSASSEGGAISSGSSGSITVSGSTISACGAGSFGGAISNFFNGSTTVNNSTLIANSAGSTGGGISLYSGGQLSVANSTIEGNTARNAGGGIGFYFGGQLLVSNCVISANRAGTNGGGLKVGAGSVTVTQSTISGNTAAENGGGMAVGYGFSTAGANLRIDRSILVGNTASGPIGGGGLYFVGTVGTNGATVDNSTIVGNAAINGGGIAATQLSGKIAITSSTITGNSATSTSTTSPGRGGGGIALYFGSTAAGAASTIALDDAIVSGNNASNSVRDIAETTTGTALNINAMYSALGTSAGYSLNNLGGNLSAANSTPAALQLGTLGNNGGPTQTVAIGGGSTAVNAGDPALAGTTDQRGVTRPQGSGVDIGAFEHVAGVPTATAVTQNVFSAAEPATYQFSVTYNDDTAINYASVNGNNNAVSVIAPLGLPAVTATFVNAIPNANAAAITATYQFTAPGGAWTTDDNGVYTVKLAANHVENTNNTFIAAGAIGSFQALVPQTYTVSNLNDGGVGSLRQAILNANADAPAADTIVFAPGLAGTIILATGPLAITDTLTIIGPVGNGIIVSGNNASQVFNIAGIGQTVVLKNLEIVGGNSTANGGGVVVGANSVTFDTDWIHGNQTASTGGGIGSTAGASITLKNCAITGNTTAAAGGGLYGTIINGTTSVTIQNSTLSGNSAGLGGGGIYLAGPRGGGPGLTPGYTPAGTLSIHNTTITGNLSNYCGGIDESGTVNIPLDLDSSIVAGNSATSGNPDFAAPTVNAVHSALGTTSGITTFNNVVGNLIGANLNLQPLALNGGSTPTIALLPGSPAIGAGYNPDGQQYDQRGAGYPRNGPAGVPDIGAFERQPGVPTATVIAPNLTETTNLTYQFTVTYADDTSVLYSSLSGNNNAITITPPAGLSPVTVTFTGATPTNNAAIITATYQFTLPAGLAMGADNGAWTVNIAGNQVENSNNIFVPAARLAMFLVQAPRTIVVTNTSFSGAGSLLAAVTQANADAPAGDTIAFSSNTADGATDFTGGPHTITLLSPLPTIADAVTIAGPGAALLTINANGTGRVLAADVAAASTVTISGLTLTGGTVVGNGAGIDAISGNLALGGMVIQGNNSNTTVTGYGGGSGGGIYFAGNLTAANSIITGNRASDGGGICNSTADPTGMVTITNSSISENTAGDGGGIEIPWAGPTLTIANSTLANNVAAGSGGAVDEYYKPGSLTITGSSLVDNSAGSFGGAIYYAGGLATTVTLDDITLADNTVGAGSNTYGGGIALGAYGNDILNVTSSTITANTVQTASGSTGYGGGGISVDYGVGVVIKLDNSIVSGNSSGNGRQDIAAPSVTQITTTYSAIGNTTGFTYTAGPGDLPIGANLDLQPLANNGGPTQTIAFAAGSPLLNAGDPALDGSTDQRGVPRPVGPAPDIGAYEYQPITVSDIQINGGAAQRSEVRSITVTFSGPVSFANGNAAAAFQLEHLQDSTDIANLAASVSINPADQTVVTLTFTITGNAASEIDPVSAENGGLASLADGQFQLTVLGAAVTDAALGWNLDGDADGTPGGDYVSPTETLGGGAGQLHLYRLFGDTDGNGVVDQVDLAQFRSADNSSAGTSAYLAYLDADNSGTIDQFDLAQFRQRSNANVFAPMVPVATPSLRTPPPAAAPVPAPSVSQFIPIAPVIAPIEANLQALIPIGNPSPVDGSSPPVTGKSPATPSVAMTINANRAATMPARTVIPAAARPEILPPHSVRISNVGANLLDVTLLDSGENALGDWLALSRPRSRLNADVS